MTDYPSELGPGLGDVVKLKRNRGLAVVVSHGTRDGWWFVVPLRRVLRWHRRQGVRIVNWQQANLPPAAHGWHGFPTDVFELSADRFADYLGALQADDLRMIRPSHG